MPTDVVGLAPGTYHSMVTEQDGSVWSTGIDSGAGKENFVLVIPSGVISAAAGTGYSIVIKVDGTVWATGKKTRTKFSFFDGLASRVFLMVTTISGAKVVAAGSHHSMVLTQTGQVWAIGWNKYGQLGDGSINDKPKFIRVSSFGTKAAAVAAGDIHSIVLRQDGSVWAAGRNNHGQLGDGSQGDRSNFVEVMSSGAINVAAGGYHSVVVKQDGSVWATGWNNDGQLGDGTTSDRMSYVQVVSAGVKAASAGSRHSMVLKQDGSVWTTGHNEYGQLGTGLKINSDVFVQVISDEVKAIAAGAFHSMVLKQNNSVWVTGSNKDGQLGDGSTKSRPSFARLSIFDYGSDCLYLIMLHGNHTTHLHDLAIALVHHIIFRILDATFFLPVCQFLPFLDYCVILSPQCTQQVVL